MLYPEKIKILAKKNLPKPEEARYWVDLTADPYGGIWKVWNGLTWIRVFASSGSGGGIEEAPSDGNLYGRKNLVWQEIDIPDVSIYATKTELSSYATLTGAQFTGTIGAPIIAVVDNNDGMRAAIQSSKNDILFRTYNAGIDSMTFLVQNSTPLKITEAGIWENGMLLENKYAQHTDIPTNISTFTNDAGYITNSSLASYATLEYVNTQISNLVNSAPEALNTLDELAAALNDDSNFATTVTNQIATKLDITTYTNDKETFALKTELSSKADSSALANYLTTAAAESTYAKKSEIPQQSLLPYDFFGKVDYAGSGVGTDTITISGDSHSTYYIGSGPVNVTFGDLINGVEYHLLVRADAGTIILDIPDLGAEYKVFVIGNKTLFIVEDDFILEMSFMLYNTLIVCRASEPSSYTIAYNNTSGGDGSFG